MKSEITKHFRRFEVKYLIPENYADKIVPSVLENMEWDRYAEENEYYECYSLYLDSLDFAAYRAVINGELFRKKMRFRLYNLEDKMGFLEMKRKKNRVIIKDRELLSVDNFQKFLADPISIRNQNWDRDFIDECVAWHWENKLDSKIWVGCKRKPFVHRLDSHFRVTFDYNLAFSEPNREGFFLGQKRKKYEKKVIMEAKFTEKMPLWFKNIIDTYKLQSSGFSKYCTGLEKLNLPQKYV